MLTETYAVSPLRLLLKLMTVATLEK